MTQRRTRFISYTPRGAKLDYSLARGYYEVLAGVAVDDIRDRRVAIATQPRVEPSFERPQRHTLAHAQRLTEDGFVSRAMRTSYAPKTGPDAEWLRDALRRLPTAHCDADGIATLEDDVLLHLTGPPRDNAGDSGKFGVDSNGHGDGPRRAHDPRCCEPSFRDNAERHR